MVWPEWWFWNIEITPHVEKRMVQRDFSEIELRTMLHGAHNFENDAVFGRFKIKSKLKGKSWEIIVEPDSIEKLLVIITGYQIEE